MHGVVHDTVDWVESILETELNSATDNPMIFTVGIYILNICLRSRGWRVRAVRHKFVTFIFSDTARVDHWEFWALSMASDNPMVHARVKSQHVYRVIPMPIILVSTMPHVEPIIILFFLVS